MNQNRCKPSSERLRPWPASSWLLPTAALLLSTACIAPEVLTTDQAATPAATDQGDPTASHLDLRISPFTDFYFLVRAQAGGVAEPTSELQPIVDAWMPVQDEIGAFGGFWRFDLPGLLAGDPDGFAEWFSDSPDTVESRRGGEIPIRGPGLAMADAMRQAWPVFLEQQWPQRHEQLQQTIDRLEADFLPRHQEALQHMLISLGIDDPQIELPTWLALDIHPPGASTYRSEDGPVLILSTRDLLGEGRFSDLTETLLHETCHALDLASDGENDTFSRMRQMLVEKGIER